MLDWMSKLAKRNPSIQKFHCDKHNIDIYIYPVLERGSFIDDNCPDVVIFENTDGTRLLKRYIENKCDYNCPTVQKLLR